jgi:hypothetical protein
VQRIIMLFIKLLVVRTRLQMVTKRCEPIGDRQTHNEQLLVNPCGVIVAWKTFFLSESVTQAKVSLFSFQ